MATRQQRRQQRRASERRGGSSRGKPPTPWYLKPWALGGAVAAVIVVVIVVVVIGNNQSKPKASFGPLPPSVLHSITNPSSGTYATVGTGGQTSPWSRLSGATGLNTSPPELLYAGADYCPYCAFERWSTINALSRFGKFSNLSLMKSSSTDIYPSTNTFSFYNSSYSSPYLTFTPIEETDRNQVALQTPTPAQSTIISTYDTSGGIPWMDLANRASTDSPGILAGVLHVTPSDQQSAALSWSQIAAKLGNPSSPQAQAVFGRANWLTAGICKATNNKPASACSAAPIPSLESKLHF
jgi:Domain of unknown function (DUF929)